MMSTPSPMAEESRRSALASSMPSPRKLFPFTFTISSPSRNRPSLKEFHSSVSPKLCFSDNVKTKEYYLI